MNTHDMQWHNDWNETKCSGWNDIYCNAITDNEIDAVIEPITH